MTAMNGVQAANRRLELPCAPPGLECALGRPAHRPDTRNGAWMTPETALGITQWVVAEGLKGSSETEVLTGFCQRLVAEGVPLLRATR